MIQDRKVVIGIKILSGLGSLPCQKVVRKPDPEEPFCGLVFKVLPAKTGDLSWVRVYSGALKANSREIGFRGRRFEHLVLALQLSRTRVN